jgi:HlyD family secretion protein
LPDPLSAVRYPLLLGNQRRLTCVLHYRRKGTFAVNQNRGKRKRRIWLWGGLVAVVVIVAAVTALALRAGDPKIPAARLAKVTRGDIAKSVVATGPIQPITKVELKSKASGLVEKLYVDINQMVTKGQVLAQLDQQEILAQVAAQRAQLAASEANVTTFSANIQQDKVNAEAPDLPMYQETWQRNVQMLKDGIVSQQALDNAERDYLAQKNRRRRPNRSRSGQAEAGPGPGAAGSGLARPAQRTAQLHHSRRAH